jgi:uncharacterized protein YndB with AHSA1/START domain
MAQAAVEPRSNENVQLRARPSLTIKRNLKASPAKIFAAWTDPAKLQKWFLPRADSEVLNLDFDVRVGGRYSITIRHGDGEHKHVSGLFREVMPNEKLSFTWAGDCGGTKGPESIVTVLIKPDGAGSLLTLIHEQIADETARDGFNQGWTSVLDNLEHYLS